MKNRNYGNQDEKEKTRQLTEAEQRRLEKFEQLSDRMLQDGYRRSELTVSIVKANVFAIVLMVPVMIIGFVLFFLKNGLDASDFRGGHSLIFLVAFLVLIVVHELVHGLSWSFYTPHGFQDIEFGFMKQYLTPYCTCSVPLSKGQYIFGALMPLVLLGIIPMVVGILCGSMLVLLLGIVMTVSAAGDIMIVWNILRYKSHASEIAYIDHPTQAGGVIFEKD